MGSIRNADGGARGKNIMQKGGVRQKSLRTTVLVGNSCSNQREIFCYMMDNFWDAYWNEYAASLPLFFLHKD